MTDPILKPALADHYALAVGQLSNAWASLEAAACHFMISLARMEFKPASLAIMRCYAFRDHLTAIKVGIVASSGHLEWIDRVIETVDYIDNYLRPRRNRFIHDQWMESEIDPPEVYLVNREPKISKPQAHMPRQVTGGSITRYELNEIEDTTSEIRSHSLYLSLLIVARDMPANQPLPDQLAKPPARLFLPRQQEKPNPKGKRPPRPPRPPRS